MIAKIGFTGVKMSLGALRGRSILNPKDFVPYERKEQIGAGIYKKCVSCLKFKTI